MSGELVLTLDGWQTETLRNVGAELVRVGEGLEPTYYVYGDVVVGRSADRFDCIDEDGSVWAQITVMPQV